MSADTTLEELIRRGPTGLLPWSAEDAAGVGAYTFRSAVFLPGDASRAARLALEVALVLVQGSRGTLAGPELTEATEAVVAELGAGAEPEAAFGVGISTYRAAASARAGLS